MKKKLVIFLAVIFTLIAANCSVAVDKSIKEGDIFPDLILSIPSDLNTKDESGLTNEKKLTVSKIKTDILLIEIFSMYCPHCQKNAPLVNELYQKIKELKNKKVKFQLIGIGAGNTLFEVNFFKQKYNIKFPLFADPDFVIHKQVGEARTPFFIGIKMNKTQKKVFFTHIGEFNNAEEFFQIILKNSKIAVK